MQNTTDASDTSFSDELMKEAGIMPIAATTEKTEQKPADDAPADEQEKKPEEKPEEKPAEKPEEKPIEKLEEKPLDKPDDKPLVPADDIDDEKLLAALRKKTGRDFKSLEEFTTPAKPPTPEETKQAEDQLRGEAIEFGKANKLFTQSDYDKFVSFQAENPADVVQADFVARMIKDDPTLTPEDAQDLFNQVYHIDEPDDTLPYKEAQKLIAREYAEIKNRDFGKIASVTDIYKDYQVFTGFATTVDKIFSNKLPAKFDFTIDGEQISFPVDLKNKKISEILTTLKKDYQTVSMMQSSSDQTGKLDEAGLIAMIGRDLKTELLDQVITEVAKSYSDITLQKAKLGRKGVLDINEETSSRLATTTADMGLSDQLLEEAGYPSGRNK